MLQGYCYSPVNSTTPPPPPSSEIHSMTLTLLFKRSALYCKNSLSDLGKIHAGRGATRSVCSAEGTQTQCRSGGDDREI